MSPKLKQLLPVPDMPRDNQGDWSKVESNFGIALPDDYKEFIENYGSFHISNFLWLLNPFAESENLNLLQRQEPSRDAYNSLKNEKIPYDFFPKEGGLILVGLTDNGDMVFWKTHPGRWKIVVNEARGQEWFSFDGGISEFIAGLLSGAVNCPIFPPGVFKE